MNFIQQKIRNRIGDSNTKNFSAPYPEGIEKDPKTPLCDFFTKNKSEVELLVIHHGDEIGEKLINSLARSYVIRKVICVPYSSIPAVIKRLEKKFDVVVPQNLEELSTCAKEAIMSSDKNIIIKDIGAYTSDISDFLDKSPNVLGVVDVTMHGYWRWEEKHLNRLPVLSIAKSKLKATENSVVGKNIINSTSYFLQKNNLGNLSEKNILVIGYGNIGENVCKYIKPLCKSLTVHDINPIKIIEAKREYDTKKDWSDIDIVFGITGKEFSLSVGDISKFKSGIMLISGSSKQVEFDLKGFERETTKTNSNDSFVEYEFNDKIVRVANNGEPINFRHLFLPSYAIEPAFAGMIKCIQRIDGGYSVPGLAEISKEDELDVAYNYLKIYK